MKNNNFEQLLQEKLDELPREIHPERDLWPGIDLALENQLSADDKNQSNRWIGIAASIAVLGLVSLLSLNIGRSPDSGQEKMQQLISNLNNQYESQKQLLLTSYEQQPALTDNWQEQLQELDSAASVIKTALEDDPGDANLIKLLQQVYQQQIKLIQSVHQPQWL
jgi:hypothetical protein